MENSVQATAASTIALSVNPSGDRRCFKGLTTVAMLVPPMLVWGSAGAAQAYDAPVAENVGVQDLYAQLQQAVCRNDWEGSLVVINPLIGSPGISPAYREELVRFRRQLQDWRAAGSFFVEFSGCQVASGRSSQPLASAAPTATATDQSITQLHAALQAAVCRNDWDSALIVINPLIGSPNIRPAYREQLVSFRSQLQDWRAAQARFASGTSCYGSAIATTTPEQFNHIDWAS
jgi:hypothetical protein